MGAELKPTVFDPDPSPGTGTPGPPVNPPPPPTTPQVTDNAQHVTKSKAISLDFLQQKFDEFFNQRTDQPIFKLTLGNIVVPGLNVEPTTPNSFARISIIDPDYAPEGNDKFGYNQLTVIDLGVLPDGFYFQDIQSNGVQVELDMTDPAPLKVTFNFAIGPDTGMPTTEWEISDLNFKEFSISVKFTVGFDTVNGTLDLLSWVPDYYQLVKNNGSGTFLGVPVPQIPDPELLEDYCCQKIVDVNIVTQNSYDVGGATQKSMRKQIFEKLFKGYQPSTPNPPVQPSAPLQPGASLGNLNPAIQPSQPSQAASTRDGINAAIKKWLVGGDGSSQIMIFSNTLTTWNLGQNNNYTSANTSALKDAFELSYVVPYISDPFPPIPPNWPSVRNPSSDPSLDFTPGSLANIDHLVVLTMENRSFDQMLGYLSLPASAGGMGRTEVDGLKGGEFNPYNGTNYPSFPFPPGATLFAPDPGHSYGPVFHQINSTNTVASQQWENGQMNGFVKAYAEESDVVPPNSAGNGSSIMGYHTGVNVPAFDALARDFAISHRWFAAHPGPTFCNRYYELSGRLNLASGLNAALPAGTWEFSNSSPLTPSFSKTIFDHLNEYAQTPVGGNLTWKYYEHAYCFLRFFSDYTFNYENIKSVNDPDEGFYADAARGTLPSVSYIDPHFIEVPPGNCDGPPADVADGQKLVRNIVEALIAGPKWNKTLLVIIYDEHGGFYDHVPPPRLPDGSVPESYNLPISTYGVRVPALFVSPWVQPGQVFGHDASAAGADDALHFDSASILKSIARRFMSDYPPYIGPRYAVAKDLTPVLNNTQQEPQFLPFLRYNFTYNVTQQAMEVQNAGQMPGAILQTAAKTPGAAQDFSFEEAGGGLVYIRTNCGNYYLTVDMPAPVLTTNPATPSPAQPLGIKQDLKYSPGKIPAESASQSQTNPDLQKWRLAPSGTTVLDKNNYVVSNAAYPLKVLVPFGSTPGALLVLGDPDATSGKNVWTVSCPLIQDHIGQVSTNPA